MTRRLLLLPLLVTACGDQPIGAVDQASRADPIFGGTLAPDEDSVVGLALDSSGYVCSGTLIRPNVVLTAAHCLNGREAGWPMARAIFGADLSSTEVVPLGDDVIPATYNGTTKRDDIGLVRLTGSAPAGVLPVPVLSAAAALSLADEGSSIRFVGYGRTETEPTGVKHQVDGTLDALCQTSDCSFSSVPVPPGSFAYGQASGGPCLGDSGGPAFMIRDDTGFVVGVTAAGDVDCLVYGISTVVDRHRDLIDDFIVAVPLANQCPSYDCPVGGACETSLECGLLSCLDEASFPQIVDGSCSAPCNPSSDECPADSRCVDDPSVARPHCFAICTPPGGCRVGYQCTAIAGGHACVPRQPTDDGGPAGDPTPAGDPVAPGDPIAPGDPTPAGDPIAPGDPTPAGDLAPGDPERDGGSPPSQNGLEATGGCGCRGTTGSGQVWLLALLLAGRRRGGRERS